MRLYQILSVYSKCDHFYLDTRVYNEICGKNSKDTTLEDIDAIFAANEKTFVNFSNELVFSFKSSYDMFRLYQLPARHAGSILKVKDIIKKVTGKKLCSLLLVGSYARNMASETSDYDFLAICDEKIKHIQNQDGKKIEVISYTTEEFKNALSEEDEFVLWGLKYGLLLYDNDYLRYFFPSRDNTFFKLKKRKKDLLERLVYRASLSISSQNISAMSVRIDDLKKQIMRSSVIALDCIPKSSPEIPEQFKKSINNGELADEIIRIETTKYIAEQQFEESFKTLRKFYFTWLRDRL